MMRKRGTGAIMMLLTLRGRAAGGGVLFTLPPEGHV